ncbi:uncharacterized protein LOC143243348 isoform X3 [Tachypleus tridentatus]|uniref:uncharacterized protein LOC143243348 isoform X3 n=1 Tax=Tachypleus tridentatus TaxID=6853 RepID=UPI003FD2E171
MSKLKYSGITMWCCPMTICTNINKLQQAGHCLCELNHLPRFCDFECVRTLFIQSRAVFLMKSLVVFYQK